MASYFPRPRRPIHRLIVCSASVPRRATPLPYVRRPWVVDERRGPITSRRVSPAPPLAYIRPCILSPRRFRLFVINCCILHMVIIVVNSPFNSSVSILVVRLRSEFFSAQRLKIPALQRLTSGPGLGY